jgi:hypothetical protein
VITNLPQLPILEHHILIREDLGRVARAVDQVVEMVGKRLGVAGLLDVFEDFEHEGGVARAVEVDFLVVGDFADFAVRVVSDVGGGFLGGGRGLPGVVEVGGQVDGDCAAEEGGGFE